MALISVYTGGPQHCLFWNENHLFYHVLRNTTVVCVQGGLGGLTSMLLYRVVGYISQDPPPKWSVLMAINGGLTGMVAICAGCNVLHPWAAAVVGVFAGITFLIWSSLVKKMRVDDPLDAVAVHMGGGLWGVISTPLLAMDTGVVYEWNKPAFYALAWNLCGAAAIIGWSCGLSVIMFGLMKACKIFRVSKEIEMKGLDIPKHGEPAYPYASYGDGWETEDSVPSVYSRKRVTTNGWPVGATATYPTYPGQTSAAIALPAPVYSAAQTYPTIPYQTSGVTLAPYSY